MRSVTTFIGRFMPKLMFFQTSTVSSLTYRTLTAADIAIVLYDLPQVKYSRFIIGKISPFLPYTPFPTTAMPCVVEFVAAVVILGCLACQTHHTGRRAL